MTLTTDHRTAAQQSQWFASWFDSIHYRRLYSNRDDMEAGAFIDKLLQQLGPAEHARMLDLGCGSGRHSRYLASKGFQVTGIDLAASSIREAVKSRKPNLRFRRHDMRVPFGKDAFDYVFNFFTSFGYFEDPADHLTVVRNVAASLTAGGRLVLDYLNVRYSEARLTPEEVKYIDGVTYRLTRWTDTAHFFKRIVIEDPNAPHPVEYCERVARFTVGDFEQLFALYGLSIEELHGDYRLSPYDAYASPRMILVARKTGEVHEDAAAAYFRERFLRMRLSVSGETPRYEATIH